MQAETMRARITRSRGASLDRSVIAAAPCAQHIHSVHTARIKSYEKNRGHFGGWNIAGRPALPSRGFAPQPARPRFSPLSILARRSPEQRAGTCDGADRTAHQRTSEG